jgi:hypothetical protein
MYRRPQPWVARLGVIWAARGGEVGAPGAESCGGRAIRCAARGAAVRRGGRGAVRAAARAELERDGQPIGAYDMLIGAHARNLGLVLVTNNRREFDRISGLRVESWPRRPPRGGAGRGRAGSLPGAKPTPAAPPAPRAPAPRAAPASPSAPPARNWRARGRTRAGCARPTGSGSRCGARPAGP